MIEKEKIEAIFAKLTNGERKFLREIRPAFFSNLDFNCDMDKIAFENFLKSDSELILQAKKEFVKEFEHDYRHLAKKYFEKWASEMLEAGVSPASMEKLEELEKP